MRIAIQHRGFGAFTLLEVLLAISLFSMVTLAVYTTFRTGMRALLMADDNSESLQSVRASMSLISSDLRSIYYMDANSYDVNFQRNKKRTNLIAENDQARIAQGLEPRIFDPNDPNAQDLYAELNDSGRPIDLSFHGQDGQDVDKIDFVRYYAGGYEPISVTWNMGRVHYLVQNGNLYRVEEDVFRSQFNFYGEQVIKDMPPPREVLARNVQVFDLRYGYWSNGEWLETETWESDDKNYRNPYRDLEALRGDPALDIFFKSKDQFPNDGLPVYIDITMGIGKDKKAIRYYQTRVFMPVSLETFRPLGEYEQQYLNEIGLGGFY